MQIDFTTAEWLHRPEQSVITGDTVTIITQPHTDFWQRTYYGFRNDNAHALLLQTDETYFSFVVKTAFQSEHRFDQCGVLLYQDSDNWFKASIEYENSDFQHLGSVVTNHGYSDWATTQIPASQKEMYYRFSRRESDYCIENSRDGVTFAQMRIFHLFEGAGRIRFGLYACSPEDSSFSATFTQMQMLPCQWNAHV